MGHILGSLAGLVAVGGAHRPSTTAPWSHAPECDKWRKNGSRLYGVELACVCGAEDLNTRPVRAIEDGQAREHAPQQKTPAAEHAPVEKDKISLSTLAAQLTAQATGPAAVALAKHVGHTWRKRARRKLGREIGAHVEAACTAATLTVSSARLHRADDPKIGSAIAAIECAAEGLELWAFLRGFEAGRKLGASEACESAAQEQLAAMRAAAMRQHSDGAVNRAEFWRQRFAALAGLPTTTTWEELRDLVEGLRATASLLERWRDAPPAGGAS